MQAPFQPLPPALPPTSPSERRFRPSVTVAAVVRRPRGDGSGPEYLLVQEHTADGLRLNNPAGHLEEGESPEQAVVREVLEETACSFVPETFLGVYLARFQRRLPDGQPGEDVTYVRFAYAGAVGEPDAARRLDVGIVGTCWLSYAEIRLREAELRSPLVLRCVDADRAGCHAPLHLVAADATLWAPEQR